MGTKNRHAANYGLMGMEEDCNGNLGLQWSAVLEGEGEEQQWYLCLTKHTVMKLYEKVKAFLTPPIHRVK
jgi:hypothetical protein